MKERKSTKMYVSYDSAFLKLIKANAEDDYFLEVLYYYIRRALIAYDYNLREVDGFNLNGRFFGTKKEVLISGLFNSPVKSISLAMSIRAIMIDRMYIKKCYDDRLLFYDLDRTLLSWDAHRTIMECYDDEDFRLLYEMVLSYKTDYKFTEEQKEQFKAHTIRPEYRNFENYCRSIASDPYYDGKSVIKNNAYLNSDINIFEIPIDVDFVGDTAFAYCGNLNTLVFKRKVLFGYFPIIECPKLRQIVVPTDLIDYYREALPYYKDIISDVVKEHTVEPASIELDKEYIWKVFEKKATSYKFFWLLAIMDIYINRKQISIPYKNVLAKMVAKAWRLWFVDKRSFGKIDQLGSYLNIIKSSSDLLSDSSESEVEEYILDNFNQGYEELLTPLLKNVPYRFLSPWIPFTTQSDVVEKSNQPQVDCLYALKDDSIVLNENWLHFLRQNASKINDFTINELKKYLEAFNS